MHAILLYYAMDTLPVDLDSLLLQFSVDPTIAIIFMFLSDILDLPEQISIRIFTIKSLLPIHICGFWKTYCRENVL